MGDEDRVLVGAKALAARFSRTRDARHHLSIVDEPKVRHQIAWLRRHRKDVWDTLLKPSISQSWQRVYPNGAEHRRAARAYAEATLGT